MNLHFITNEGTWHAETDSVRFFALAGEHSITFDIARAALERLEETTGLNTGALEAAYTKNIAKLREAAKRVYTREGTGSFAPYQIRATDL
jgi:hypothetical protein